VGRIDLEVAGSLPQRLPLLFSQISEKFVKGP
jgi:hypothetical protein